jgi:hypothetical protein
VRVLVDVQPVHEEKVLPPELAGAVKVTVVPELYVRVKLVEPLAALLLSAGETVMATPLAGSTESTVRTEVIGGGFVDPLLDEPPQPVRPPRPRQRTRTHAAGTRTRFTIFPLCNCFERKPERSL